MQGSLTGRSEARLWSDPRRGSDQYRSGLSYCLIRAGALTSIALQFSRQTGEATVQTNGLTVQPGQNTAKNTRVPVHDVVDIDRRSRQHSCVALGQNWRRGIVAACHFESFWKTKVPQSKGFPMPMAVACISDEPCTSPQAGIPHP